MKTDITEYFGDHVYIISDYDGDGFSSAWILYNCLKNMNKIPKVRFYIRSSKNEMGETNLLNKVLSKDAIDSVVVLDLSFDRFTVRKTGKNIVWIDHHYVREVPRDNRIIFINPRLKNKDIYKPTSCLLFELLKDKECFNKKMLFMSALGTLSDIGLKDCSMLYKIFSEHYKGFFNPQNIEDYEKTKLFRYVKLLNSALILNRSNSKLNILLRKIKDPVKDISSREFIQYQNIVDKEIKKELERFKKHKIKISKDIVLYVLNSKLPIKTIVAYKLAKTYKKKIIIVGQKISKNKVSISVRKGKLVKDNILDVVSALTELLGVEKYGGHPKAVGGVVNIKRAKIKI